MSKNLSSVAVMIGALRVKKIRNVSFFWLEFTSQTVSYQWKTNQLQDCVNFDTTSLFHLPGLNQIGML